MNSLSGQFSIQVGKKKYQCHLSMNAFRLMCEQKGISLNEMQQMLGKNPLSAVPQILHQGLLTHCFYHQKPIDDLPEFEYFAARILDKPEDLEKYAEHIRVAFEGEAKQEPSEEGNE
tara:strand:- start:1090 stop:1440 length:351 start_codon:yes stop_codon:yes gene_type:complete